MSDSIKISYVWSRKELNDNLNKLGTVAWVIGYWKQTLQGIPSEIPSITSHDTFWDKVDKLQSLDWPAQVFEIISDQKVTYEKEWDILYTESKEFIVGAINLYEESNEGNELVNLARVAYEQIHHLLNKTSKTKLVRVWNYVTNILGETSISVDWEVEEINRYKAFCLWRSVVIDETFNLEASDLPTATGIWNHQERRWIKIFFIASNKPDIQNHINPYQTIPSYYNQEKYWIKALKKNQWTPRFNRSTTIKWENLIFVGGTASILWEEVVHLWDIAKQTWQSLQNILYTMEEASRNTGIDFTKYPALLKVFIKNIDDYELVKAEIISDRNPLPNNIVDIIYIHADVCRDEWLVEISCEVSPEIK